MDMWTKVQPLLTKAYSMSPLALGIAIGYLGHPIIKMGIDIAMLTIKGLLKI